jgi:putative nucleotidyltransferase with HDIG domain
MWLRTRERRPGTALKSGACRADDGIVRREALAPVAVGATIAAAIFAVLWARGVDLTLSTADHVSCVGLGAATGLVMSVILIVVSVRRSDTRSLAIGVAFGAMAALLAVHAMATPGYIVGQNGLIAFAGGLTIPTGAVLLALAPRMGRPSARRWLVAGAAALGMAIATLGVVGLTWPNVIPAAPDPEGPAAEALLAVTLFLLAIAGRRAWRTATLTGRAADWLAPLGVGLLAAAVIGALTSYWGEAAFWLGHAFETTGICLVAGSVLADLARDAPSRVLQDDTDASRLVIHEEAFLGAQVHALTRRLAEKDHYTERHVREVALLAVQVGARLGLGAARLRTLAVGGLLHDMGKLTVPDAILKKPSSLDPDEYAIIRTHPVAGTELLAALGFTGDVLRLVRSHHERLDGGGYPDGVAAATLPIEVRILTVCDVYDALVSDRVYRPGWSVRDALAHLRGEAGKTYDVQCVEMLAEVVGGAPAEDRRAA